MRYYIRLLFLPLFLLIIFSSYVAAWKLFGLSSTEELTEIIKAWFDTYGLPIVFLSSVVEGILLVGSYFPGAFVLFLAVILSDSILQAALVVLIITLGLFLGHVFNYTLGKYGWYKLLVRFGLKNAVEQARERLVNKGSVAIFLSYWSPSVGALTDTAAGILRMPFKKFLLYSFIAVTLWDILAGTLVYTFKDAALYFIAPDSSGIIVIFGIISIWIAVVLIVDFYKRKKQSSE